MIYCSIPKSAVAIRPVRIVGNKLRHYTALTGPKGKDRQVWVRGVLNRVSVCAVGKEYYSDLCALDLLDRQRNIVLEYILSIEAFNYARKQLGFKIESNE